MRILFIGNRPFEAEAVYRFANEVSATTKAFDWIIFIGQYPPEIVSSFVGSKPIVHTPTFYFRPTLPQIEFVSKSSTKNSGVALEGRGLLTSPDGLNIAFSIEDINDICEDEQMISGVADILKAQLSASSSPNKNCDILITNVVPRGYQNFTSDRYIDEREKTSLLAARLALELKPRYHLCNSKRNYERAPYRNHTVLVDRPCHATRLVLLTNVSFQSDTGMYGLNLKPLAENEAAGQEPAGTTPCPYNH